MRQVVADGASREARRRGAGAERAALLAIRGAVAAAAALSVSNFSPLLVPPGAAALQQLATLAAWGVVALASHALRPAARMGAGTERLALALFYGVACASVLWANNSPSSLMKAVALALTTYGAWRAAVALPIEGLVDCMAAGFAAVLLASLGVVLLLPSAGIDHTWLHDGYWQGVFESKQALGAVSALLIVLDFHRWRCGRTRAWRFLALAAVAGAVDVMSGSRDSLSLLFIGCGGLWAGARSPTLLRALCFAPAALWAGASALLAYLWATGQSFIPVFGAKVDLTERVVIWAYALSHFGDRPLFGFGLDGFWSDERVLSAFERQHGWVLDNYHDGFLAVLIETGLVGSALFGATALLFGIKAAWLGRPDRMDPAAHRLMVVMVAALFFGNLTESYTLRSTNVFALLTLVLMFSACRLPPRAAAASRPARLGGAAHRPARRAAVAVAALAAAAAAGPARAEEPAFAAARAWGGGVNVLGYDGLWDGHPGSPFPLSNFRLIRAAGFRNVRINLFGFRHMDAGGRLDDAFLSALDDAVGAATAAGLAPIVDEHDSAACGSDPDGCAPKLKRFWSQVAARYAGRFPRLAFEVLNEPGGAMDWDRWNALAADCLAIIRAANPGRTVVIAARNGSPPREMDRLLLPEADRNIVVTLHYYAPMRFTHQGAPWIPDLRGRTGVAWGGAADENAARADLDGYAAWGAAHRRPIWLGEFGAYDAAPMASRAAYVGFVSGIAAAHGWPWTYWQFDHDFAVYDEAGRRWIRPILDALEPGGAGR